MQNAVPIELSDKDFNDIRSLFPKEAADAIDRRNLAEIIAKFWKVVHRCLVEFGRDVVAITADGKSVDVIAPAALAGVTKNIEEVAIRVFKRACELLCLQQVTAIAIIGPGIRMRLVDDWMRPFGAHID